MYFLGAVHQFLEEGHLFRANVAENLWHEICKFLCFRVSENGKGIAANSGLDFRSIEMNNGVVISEEIDFINIG